MVFGDNLSDPGNVFHNNGYTYPPPPYFDGHFTNGATWIEHASLALGLGASTPTLTGGFNYAFGGAATGEGLDGEIPRIGRQIDRYLAYRAPEVGDLHVVWAGLNDLITGGVGNDPVDLLDRLSDHVSRLASVGATDFFVPNMPPIDQFPEFRATAREVELSTAVAAFNSMLELELPQLALDLGVTILPFDAHAVFSQVLSEPAAYGFTDVTLPAYDVDTGFVVPNPDAHMFWDTTNPTARFHEILCEAAIAAIPEPAGFLMLAVSIPLLRRRH